MNYRHAFHAGNFADCMKHALLVALLRALQKKEGGLFVLDTHAGIGRYDLTADPAQRTGEWQQGIARLLDDPPPPLLDYVGLVRQLGLYPGSPALIRALLRPQDRLACCELHPEDAATLRAHVGHDPQIAVHHRDGWDAIRALLPPPGLMRGLKRGLILIDPPFEERDDHARIVAAIRTARTRFPGGIVAAWYPIKHRAPVHALHLDIAAAGIRDVIAAEMWLRPPLDPTRLNGCGLLIAAPPWRFEADAEAILSALVHWLDIGADSGHDVLRLTDE